MVADANNDDDGSSGSSTRLNTVPSSVPIRRRSSTGNLLMSPFGRRAERYPLHTLHSSLVLMLKLIINVQFSLQLLVQFSLHLLLQ